ncbi:MAG: hypothetical protein Q4P14_01690 [Methanobacteriaceae archaeon]|nr:hypothetical protein [Methanobacteriaceae archaeon]
MNKILFILISFLFPGIGQIIKGKVLKGILMLIIYIISWLLIFIPGMGIIRLIYMIYSAYDANKIETDTEEL